MKRSLIFAVLLLAALPAFAADKRTTVAVGNSPSLGPENAPVTIVEFVDFQ
jgi:protein-disulfide isomerase